MSIRKHSEAQIIDALKQMEAGRRRPPDPDAVRAPVRRPAGSTSCGGSAWEWSRCRRSLRTRPARSSWSWRPSMRLAGLRFSVRLHTDATDSLISEAEEESFRTCESCGRPGWQHENGCRFRRFAISTPISMLDTPRTYHKVKQAPSGLISYGLTDAITRVPHQRTKLSGPPASFHIPTHSLMILSSVLSNEVPSSRGSGSRISN